MGQTKGREKKGWGPELRGFNILSGRIFQTESLPYRGAKKRQEGKGEAKKRKKK